MEKPLIGRSGNGPKKGLIGKKPSRSAKKRRERSAAIDPAVFGIDMPGIIGQIKPHLEDKTQAEIANAVGTSPAVISHYLNGYSNPSIGALAALAAVTGGRLVVRYEPPKRKGIREGLGEPPPRRAVDSLPAVANASRSKKKGESSEQESCQLRHLRTPQWRLLSEILVPVLFI